MLRQSDLWVCAFCALLALNSCTAISKSQDAGSDGGSGGDGGTGVSSAADLARKLNLTSHFLIGMGNDLAGDHNRDGVYTLGTKLDLHDCYLVGLMGQGGWPDWNPGGSFVNILANTAAAHGVVPMFTLYSMAAWGEGNFAVLTNDDYMRPYWNGAALLFDRLAAFNQPGIVHIEPDFWAFAQRAAPGGDPSRIPAHVSSLASECSGLPNDLTGMGRCLVRMARNRAPKAVVGFHASVWAGPPGDIVNFLNRIGAADSDMIVVDTLDRDAGCFEAHVDPNCQRNDGPWYWDETNRTTPNFHQHLDWAKALHVGLNKPVLWWQMPFGVPSPTPGGTAGHYRDNRVHYLFNHVDEFVAAGGVGSVFGVGAANQTYITTDGDQFKNAVSAYFASPVSLP
jgi:hypothetical protein